MSVYGMKPTFTDYEGFKEWRKEWLDLYRSISQDIRETKYKIKNHSRVNDDTSHDQRELVMKRVMAKKLMTVLSEAKIRWYNIVSMKNSIKDQNRMFPLDLGETRNIDFHFNKKSLEFPFIPMWVLKAKGKTYYVNHVECNVPWSTRETPDHPSTKGSIRIKRGHLKIDDDGVANIR